MNSTLVAILSDYYTAPLEVYTGLPVSPQALVCTCGEWNRIPSNQPEA